MSRLSLCEIAQSQLAATPIVDGQLVCCLDTGRFYRDTHTHRKELAAGLEVVNTLPLAPITQKLYLLEPGALYIYDEGWVRLNGAEDLIANKVDKADGKGLSSNDFTDALLAKLNGIATGANRYIHPAYTEKSNGLYKVTVDSTGHIGAAALVNKKDITDLGVPAQDTTYSTATASTAGLMSAADKIKLNGIATGAQVNSVTGVKGNAESSYRTGNVNITPANIGLGNVNNTADSAKSVASAAKLTTARNIVLSGGAVGSASFDGSRNISLAVTSLDAAKLTGVVGIEHLPAGALERCVRVENDTARFALTASDVQKGDTVKVDSTGLMYFVADDTKLGSAAGYLEYTAGAATSVPWSGVTGKPAVYTPAAHQHTIASITDLAAASVANAKNANDAIYATNAENAANDANGQAIAATYIKGLSVSGRNITYTKGNGATASFATQDTTYGAATSSANGLMTAEMVTKLNGIATGAQVNSVTGVKGSAESSYRTGNVNITPANIGLGNVNNTADSAKSVKNAVNAGYATKADYSSGMWFRLNNRNDGVALNTDNNSLNLCAGQTQVRNKTHTAWATIFAGAFSQQSSRRYKDNIEDMGDAFAYNLLKIRPVRFDYKNKLEYGDMANGCSGVIAEEVADVQQWGVVKNDAGVVDGVDYAKFVPQLIKLCQIQQREIDALKKKMETLGV